MAKATPAASETTPTMTIPAPPFGTATGGARVAHDEDAIADEATILPNPPMRPVAEDDEDNPAPKVAPIAPAKPAAKGKARVCTERERACAGCKRYRVRVRNYTGFAYLYIIAVEGDLDGIKKCYLEASGLGAYAKKRAEDGVPAVELKRPSFDILVLKD